MRKLKILNNYGGIGGNRKDWGDDYEITAVEYKPEIAKIYQDFFPNDKVIVGDAHQYLLDHFKEFDFIWSSPPCPSHSRMNHLHNVKGLKPKFPDMELYEEIILLQTFFKGKYCVENVRSYYKPLIPPQEIQSHYFWANFLIRNVEIKRARITNNKGQTLDVKMKANGFVINDFHGYKGDKRTLVNNCVEPELGKHILDCAMGLHPQKTLL